MNKFLLSNKKLLSVIMLWFGCVFIFAAVSLTILEANEKKVLEQLNDKETVNEEAFEKRSKINLLELMNKTNYIYKDIVIKEAYIEYNSKYYSFNGTFLTNKNLNNYEFIIVLKNENGEEITRYTEITEMAFMGEELLMYEEFGIELDNVTSFEIIDK